MTSSSNTNRRGREVFRSCFEKRDVPASFSAHEVQPIVEVCPIDMAGQGDGDSYRDGRRGVWYRASVGLVLGLADPIFDQRQKSRSGDALAAVGEKRVAVTSHATEVEVVPQGVDCHLPDDESSSVLGPGLGQKSSSYLRSQFFNNLAGPALCLHSVDLECKL